MNVRLLPRLADEPYAQPFWEGARNQRLRLQHCPSCDRTQFFPRPWCQTCGKPELNWIEARGTGQLHSYTVVRRAIKNPEYEPDIPYILGLIELPEGPRLYSRLVDCEADTLAVGLSVEVTFKKATKKVTLPVFRPMTSG